MQTACGVAWESTHTHTHDKEKAHAHTHTHASTHTHIKMNRHAHTLQQTHAHVCTHTLQKTHTHFSKHTQKVRRVLLYLPPSSLRLMCQRVRHIAPTACHNISPQHPTPALIPSLLRTADRGVSGSLPCHATRQPSPAEGRSVPHTPILQVEEGDSRLTPEEL